MAVYFRKWKRAGRESGAWYWNFMTGGVKSHKRAVHPDNPRQKARTRKEALVFEAIARQRISQNLPVFDKPKTNMTFRRFTEEIYRPYAEANLRSHKTQGYHLKLLTEAFGELLFDQISPFAIEKFKVEQLRRGMSGNTVRLYLATGTAICSLAIGEGAAKANPFREVATPELQPRLKRRLEAGEEERLMKACSSPERLEAEGRRDHLASAIVIMLDLGPRPTELFSLKVDEVDWSESLVKFTSYKTGHRRRSLQPKTRIIPATSAAMIELERLRKESKTNRLYPYDSIKKAWASACREAGVSGFWFRWLRDEAASRWAEAGATPYEIAYLLGHADVVQGQGSITRMSMLYVKPMIDRLRGVMELASSSRIIRRNFIANVEKADPATGL